MQKDPLTRPSRSSQPGVSEQQLRAMFSQSAVGIAVSDLAGRFVDANDCACALLGYPLAELTGRGFLELTHADDVERTRDCVARLRAGEINSYTLEKRYLRKDGAEIWSNTTVTALHDADGEVEGFIGFLQDISRRMQGEEVKSRLAAVVRSSDDAIITKSLDGTISTWNPAAERMFGYTAQEAIGSPITMLFPEDRMDEELEILARLRRNEPIHHYETVRRRKDGTLIDVSLSVSPVLDAGGRVIGASKIARDITRQKRDELALMEHSQVLELLVSTGKSIASSLDLQAILQRVTDLGTQMSGAEFGAFFYYVGDGHGGSCMLYTLAGAPRSAFEKFGLPRNTPVFHATFSGEGVVRSDDITQDPRYGKIPPHFGMPEGHLPVRSYLAVPVIARSGQVLGGLFFGHSRAGVFDERAEKVLTGVAAQAAVAMDNAQLYEEAQREIANREMAEARLREADRRKDEFLATLAHELRNPLAPIRQAAAVAGAPGSSDEQKRWGLQVIDRQVRHMSVLLNDLLDVARITRGVFDLRMTATTVGEIVDSAIETARPSITSRQHSLRVEVPRRDAALTGDPLRLAQILANLLLNASKYTDPRGVITLRATDAAGNVEFSVRDTGIGIEPATLNDLFGMFKQVSSHRDRSEGGLGIGLALAKGLAELHGGTIEAHSEGPGRGSEFIVRIPRRLEEQSGVDEPGSESPRASASRSVLIADDNEDAARTLAMLLEVSGHRVTVAHDGEQALARFDELQPEFVLLDIGMPRLDGYEVARRLRERAGNKPKLVALTGWGQETDKARARAAGFDQHFTKPIDPDRILDLLGGTR
jgi:PAS domain S-box-containing protein